MPIYEKDPNMSACPKETPSLVQEVHGLYKLAADVGQQLGLENPKDAFASVEVKEPTLLETQLRLCTEQVVAVNTYLMHQVSPAIARLSKLIN